jgi:hypothetical protein
MKQKIVICLCAFVAFLSVSTLQAQGWDKTFVGVNAFQDTTFAYSVIETSDSGFVFAGGSTSVIANVATVVNYITKTDKRGNVIWKAEGFVGSTDTIKIFQTADNGFLAVGTSRTFDNTTMLNINSIGVIKLNSNGVVQSTKSYLAKNTFTDADITPNLDEIVVSSYQQFLLINSTYYAFSSNLLRLSPNGDSIGVKTFPNVYVRDIAIGGDRQIYGIRQTAYPYSCGTCSRRTSFSK